ncbi:RNA polymerase sigma factor [Arthrobacter sp.]|uniref:RNA polymerase sigma factor n=1 Tax=Arthrobacter sp. TaxID=1667 RepID=UPI0026E0AAE5|nr:sigma-70 family RNA polymerase sigma factor [Arthrobacter sp.]MDO5752298.1 sigma-70 family RNA polymerase sigma factor [Arthrobacter sp.]
MSLARQDSFLALHEEFKPRVLGYVRRRISSDQTAEEIAADVFRIAWQKSDSEPNPSIGWLLNVARNLIGNEYRSHARAMQLQERLRDTERINAQGGDDAGTRNAIAAALEKLREKDREILLLTYWEDLTLAEIAHVLSCREATARVRLHRARKSFERALPHRLRPEGRD